MSTADAAEEVGTPQDGRDALAQALITWAPAPDGDPKLSLAFVLGWSAAEVTAWAGTGQPPPDAEDFGLGPVARWTVLHGQIATAQKQLIPEPTVPVPLLAGAPPETGPPEAAAFGDGVLAQLCIVDALYGKAFQLGFELQQFCSGEQVTAEAIARLKKLLVTLATKLPPNAAHSVINSLTLWEEAIGSKAVADRLQRQGKVWRPILAGEVAARDLLHLSDYVGTAEEVIGRLQDVARRALKGRLLGLAITIVALIVIGIVVLIVGHSSGSVTAGAGSLLAAFGLTWKGLGQYLGHAAAQAEQALWDAQVNWTIAYRSTVPKQSTGETHKDQRRRRQGHVNRWKTWQRDWPDIELDA